tara:strand:- start:850 stop:1134 length:285 start_codon:yes stop_codon:yes gene_type:complete
VKKWFLYVVCCSDGTLYTGVTTDLKRRLHEHNNNSRGAKYTKNRRPVKLVYWTTHANRSEAQREEHRIKQLSKTGKGLLIIANFHTLEPWPAAE